MNKLCFCSTTYGGYGIVRVGSLIPQCHMLFVGPASCGRHTSINAIMQHYKNKISYLFIDKTEVSQGTVEDELYDAVNRLLSELNPRPKVLLVYICCILYLSGFDESGVTDRLSIENPGIRFKICLMNPVAADTKRPPSLTMQQSMYSLLDFDSPQINMLNFLGNNVSVNHDSEIYNVLMACGVNIICHVSEQQTFEEFRRMGQARWNLVIRPEALLAAKSVFCNTDYRFVPVSYDLVQIRDQYDEIFDMLSSGCRLDDYERKAENAIKQALVTVGKQEVAIGATAVCRPFSLARALLGYGFRVTDIFGCNVTLFEQESYNWILDNSPEIQIYDTGDPGMIDKIGKCGNAKIAIGYDAGYFSGAESVVNLTGDEGMFGYYGVELLMNMLIKSVMQPEDLQTMIEAYGLVA